MAFHLQLGSQQGAGFTTEFLFSRGDGPQLFEDHSAEIAAHCGQVVGYSYDRQASLYCKRCISHALVLFGKIVTFKQRELHLLALLIALITKPLQREFEKAPSPLPCKHL